MSNVLKLNIKGYDAELPILPLPSGINIAFFNLHGNQEMTEHCGKALAKLLNECEVLITAESKGIPLVYEMARKAGMNKYILARKGIKAYMSNVLSVEVHSITTAHKQTLHLDGDDVAYMNGKRVLIVDDVISTGESLHALEELVNRAGGKIVGKMAVLAEGDAIDRKDIIYLEPLPLFDSNGNPLG